MTTLHSALIAMIVSSFTVLGVGAVHADDTASLAKAHFKAISGGNADGIVSFYAPDAEFRWVGGPLAGVYKGKDKIRDVWDKFAKFTKSSGDIDHEVLELSESASGKTSTVTALVKFKFVGEGEGEVPVRFTVVYKDSKIASETWQVDKGATTTLSAHGAPHMQTASEGKVVAEVGNPVPPPAANTPAPPAVEQDYKPQDATPAQINAVQTVPLPVPAPTTPVKKAAVGEPEKTIEAQPKTAVIAVPSKKAEILPEKGVKTQPQITLMAIPSKRAEVVPEKGVKTQPKAVTAKLKAKEDKKRGYAEKVEQKKVGRTMRYYGYGYGYDRRDYDRPDYGYNGGYGYDEADDDDYAYDYGGRGYSRYGSYGYGGYGGYGRGGYGGGY